MEKPEFVTNINECLKALLQPGEEFSDYFRFEEDTRDTLNRIVVTMTIVPFTKAEHEGRRASFRLRKKNQVCISRFEIFRV